HVCISSCHGRTIEPVLDHDETAVATGKFGDRGDTVSSGEDWRPIRRCEVCTSVEGAFAGERVDTRAEVTGMHPGSFWQREYDARSLSGVYDRWRGIYRSGRC